MTGAAVATNIGRGIAVLIQLWTLGPGHSRIHIRRRHIELVPAVMWNVCRLSGSGFLQILIDTTSYIGLVRVICDLRQRCAGRLHHRHPHRDLRA